MNLAQKPAPQSPVANYVYGQFPGKILISVQDFAELTNESYGGLRNRLAHGTFPLPVVRRGTRNFVSIFDVISYLERIISSREFATAVAKPAAAEARAEAGKRISKYGEEAKARAAVSKARRQAAVAKARQAKAALRSQGGAA